MASGHLHKEFENLVKSSGGYDPFIAEIDALVDAAVSDGAPAVRGIAQEAVSMIVGSGTDMCVEVFRAKNVLGRLVEKSPEALPLVCESMSFILASGGINAGRVHVLLTPCLYNKPQNRAPVLKAIVRGIQQGCNPYTDRSGHEMLSENMMTDVSDFLLTKIQEAIPYSDVLAEIKTVVPKPVPVLERVLHKLEEQVRWNSNPHPYVHRM